MVLAERSRNVIANPSPKRRVLQAVALSAGALLLLIHPVPAAPPAASSDRVPRGRLATAIAQTRSTLRPLVGRGDLLETLYFGWFDRPYQRATLACAFKTLAVLEYESKLRELGNGAIADDQLERIIEWTDSVGRRTAAPARRPGFRPNRVPAARTDVLDTLSSERGRPAVESLFGFIDRATATPCDDQLGDFDLLACLGFRVVGISPVRSAGARERSPLLRRAQALRIALVTTGVTGEDPDRAEGTPLPQPASLVAGELADFIADTGEGSADPSALRAVIDPPHGESWPESLARRALYRGATGRDRSIVTGWSLPRTTSAQVDLPERISAAMWVHALDGQRLGLLEGWRDVRDGSASPYASITLDPGAVEAVAATALDLLYFREVIERFDGRPEVAVVVEPDALRSGSSNRWSEDYAALFDALTAQQIRFDVLPRSRLNDPPLDRAYQVVIEATDKPRAGDQRLFVARAEAGNENRVLQQTTPGVTDLAAAIAEHLATGGEPSDDLIVRDSHGAPPPDVLVFSGRDSSVAVVNIADAPTEVRIKNNSEERAPALRDVLSNETIADPTQGLPLRPWQVRVLVPTET